MPTTVISQFLLRWLLAPIVLLWAYHLWQRRFAESVGRKREASLLLTGLMLALWVVAYIFARYRLADLWLAPAASALVALAIWQRRRLFPYRLTCAQCGKPLSAERVLFRGSNACSACDP